MINPINYPLFYNNEELEALKGLSIADKIREEQELWKNEYIEIVNAVPEFKKIELCDYIKTSLFILSKTFHCYNAPDKHLIVPLAGIN